MHRRRPPDPSSGPRDKRAGPEKQQARTLPNDGWSGPGPRRAGARARTLDRLISARPSNTRAPVYINVREKSDSRKNRLGLPFFSPARQCSSLIAARVALHNSRQCLFDSIRRFWTFEAFVKPSVSLLESILYLIQKIRFNYLIVSPIH